MSDVIFRKFWFENDLGESIALNGENAIWFVNVTGLGANNSTSYTDYKNGFFIPVEADKDPQQQIAGDLYFFDATNPYGAYRQFIDWVMQSTELYFVYAPSVEQYRRKVRFNTISKTELLTQESIKIPIILSGLSPWIKKTTYDEWVYTSDISYYKAHIDVITSGHLSSGFSIEHIGPLGDTINVVLSKATSSSVFTYIGRCRIDNADISSSADHFIYSSLYDGSKISKISQNTETSLINNIVFVNTASGDEYTGYEPFPKIIPNIKCRIELQSKKDVSISQNIKLTVVEYFKGV